MARHSVTAYLLGPSPVRLFHPLPSVSSLSSEDDLRSSPPSSPAQPHAPRRPLITQRGGSQGGGGGLYLGGDGAAEQYSVAEVEGRGVGEDAQPVPAVRRHAEGAVPLVQGEEERREVQRDEDAHPHGPVQGPHEGADGGGGVPAPDLRGVTGKQLNL